MNSVIVGYRHCYLATLPVQGPAASESAMDLGASRTECLPRDNVVRRSTYDSQ